MSMQQSHQIWIKNVECPLCYEDFATENIWQNKVVVLKEYPDLGKKYAGTNPLFYSVWVCPNCLYADFRGDEFMNTGKISDEAFEDDLPVFRMVAGNSNYREPRTFALAVTSYKLAILTAKHKKTSVARLGTFNLRLAWLYRSLQKTELEKKHVQFALNYYLEAFTKEDKPDFGAMSDGGITYLLGELYRQTGDIRNAVNFFQKVINDKKMNTEPKYIKQARLQWESLKDNPNASTEVKEIEPTGESISGEEV